MADSRFPPLGRRGFGSPICSSIWGLGATEYFTAANDSVLVIVQIETPEGVQNVESIAAVDGIGAWSSRSRDNELRISRLDVLFIGPYDLSLSLGYPAPSPDPHPEVEKIIQNILKVSHSAGKKW